MQEYTSSYASGNVWGVKHVEDIPEQSKAVNKNFIDNPILSPIF
jgi:hypothetical protein